MGQIANPNIIRLGKTKNWQSKYLEKKISETPNYAFKAIEIKKFISKLFIDNGLIVKNCKVHLSSDEFLNLHISYYLAIKSTFLINNVNTKHKMSFYKNFSNKKDITIKHVKIKQNVKNYAKLVELESNYFAKIFTPKTAQHYIKSDINVKKVHNKIRRLNLIKYYKNFLIIQKFKNTHSIKINSFLEKVIKSLQLFLTKSTKILLTTQLINKNFKQRLNKEKLKTLKKSLVKLKKYGQNEFLKEGANIVFTSINEPKGSKLLSNFISHQLARLKRHNFFLKFLKTTLIIFKNNKFSSVKGIKIKIKGRFNGVPRAKHKIITIGEGVPVITLNSNIDYSESTSYTLNGTFGVKVWIYYSNQQKL